MNPLGNGMPQATQQIINLIQMAQGNPQAVMQMMSKQNPQAAQQLQQIMQSGKNPRDIAMQMMKERGIDPEQVMGAIKQLPRK